MVIVVVLPLMQLSLNMTAHQSRVPTQSKSKSNADRWFYVIVTMLVILVNVVGFSPSLLNPATRTVPLPLTSLDLAHSLVSVTWLLVFMAQVTLVAARRVTVHRQLGVLGSCSPLRSSS